MAWYNNLAEVGKAAGAIGLGGPVGASAYFGYKGGQAQAEAAAKAQAENAALAREMADRQQIAGAQARGRIYDAQAPAEGAIQDYTQLGSDYLASGYGNAGQLSDYYYGTAQDRLSGALGGATNVLGAATDQARGDISGALQGSRLAGLLDEGLYSGFEQDPGYQFRQQQGEQAIMRSAAARGGRLGGDTMKALADYNQGLASQEFGNFANRRLAQAGQAGAMDAQSMGAAGRLADLAYGTGGTLAGYGMSQGAALAGLDQSVGGQQVGLATDYAQRQAGMASGLGSNLANLYTGAANNMANTYMGAAANSAQAMQPAFQNPQLAAAYAGQGWNTAGNMANQLTQLGMMGLSMYGGGAGAAGAARAAPKPVPVAEGFAL